MKRVQPHWLIAVLILFTSGCALHSAQPPTRPQSTIGVQPTATATAPAAAQSPVLNNQALNSTWHTLYTRPDFDSKKSVDLRAVGDISLARNIEPIVRRHEPDWLFAASADLLRGDVVVGNLESPFTERRRPEQLRPGPYRLPADPVLADRLAPFTALSLANNHALDASPDGLAEAQQTLQEVGITPLGVTGNTCGTSNAMVIQAEMQLQILAFNAVSDPEDRPDEEQECGRAWLDDEAIEQIRRLQETTSKPIVVLVHWGSEYESMPNAQQRMWAHKLVAAGVDLVVGAHPHVVQPAELLEAAGQQGFVAYSLGNFVFDQPDQQATSHSVVLRAQFDAQGLGSVSVAPVALHNGRSQPLALDDPAAQAQLAAITVDTSNRQGWRWDGTTFVETKVPDGTILSPPPTELAVDLRGDDEPLQVTLKDGLAQVWDGGNEVWRNEAEQWHVAGMAAGDADNDGRYEVLLRLWKPDADGTLRSHPFMLGWRGGYYRVFWGGSAVAEPIQDAAIGRVSGSRNALVVLEGGNNPGEPAKYVGVWTWQGWNFQQQWRSPPGRYHRLALLDLDGDGLEEIVVE